MEKKKKINDSDIYKQIKNPSFRRKLARESFYWFFTIYLSSYIKYEAADFQKKIFNVAQDKSKKLVVITAFRGSGKSTIASLAYPIWSMISGQKKFIIILSQNQNLCKLILSNIKVELEKNLLLIRDFGPFKQVDDEWRANALLVSAYGTRIAYVSSGEAIRGIRNQQNRPDLIILDDVEDISSTKTKEGRKKTFDWVTREVIPTGDEDTKVVIVGNKIHEDCLMMRLKKAIKESNFPATYMEYPLLDENGVCIWPQKFKTEDSINYLKESVVTDSAWKREYLLRIVPEDDAVILREWIHYYDNIPLVEKPRIIATGIDLAISENSKADKTAMVSAKAFGYGDNLRVYILPNSINKRISFPHTVEEAKLISTTLGNGTPTKLYIEEVAYQGSIIQQLKSEGYPAEGVKVAGSDKRSRLAIIAHWIHNGNVLFPKKGCEELITQLVDFGYETHDDLSDAFAILMIQVIKKSRCYKIQHGYMPDGRIFFRLDNIAGYYNTSPI
jgi:predicted phage terminase large subunit-like protein